MLGLFIVLEGIDGSGKTTQAKKLVNFLRSRGRRVWLTREPTDGSIGREIRRHLQAKDIDNESLQKLFLQDRREHVREINSKLREGYDVVCDRYTLSTIAYGSLNIAIEKLKKLNKEFLKPDITIIIDVEPEIAFRRITRARSRNEYFDTLSKLARVRQAYLSLQDFYPNTFLVDGSKSIEECWEEIRRIVQNFLQPASCCN